MACLKKGDILRSAKGALRIVRRVSHWGPTIPRTSVTFAIQRCSWTHRPYTIYNGNDLRQMGYQPTTTKAWPLDSEFDQTLEQAFDCRSANECKFHCCDVMGVA